MNDRNEDGIFTSHKHQDEERKARSLGPSDDGPFAGGRLRNRQSVCPWADSGRVSEDRDYRRLEGN
jgi:hypothetical protein